MEHDLCPILSTTSLLQAHGLQRARQSSSYLRTSDRRKSTKMTHTISQDPHTSLMAVPSKFRSLLKVTPSLSQVYLAYLPWFYLLAGDVLPCHGSTGLLTCAMQLCPPAGPKDCSWGMFPAPPTPAGLPETTTSLHGLLSLSESLLGHALHPPVVKRKASRG